MILRRMARQQCTSWPASLADIDAILREDGVRLDPPQALELRDRRTLVCVPSLALTSQLLDSWLAQRSRPYSSV